MENTEQTQEQLSALLQVRRDKLTELQNDGRDPFKITKFERTHTSAQLKENYTEEDRELKKRGSDEVQIIKAQVSQFDGQTVSIAGRIMSKRGMGKVGFVHVSDIDGQIQLFVKKDILGADPAPGCTKALVIDYRCGELGITQRITAYTGSQLSLDCKTAPTIN